MCATDGSIVGGYFLEASCCPNVSEFEDEDVNDDDEEGYEDNDEGGGGSERRGGGESICLDVDPTVPIPPLPPPKRDMITGGPDE